MTTWAPPPPPPPLVHPSSHFPSLSATALCHRRGRGAGVRSWRNRSRNKLPERIGRTSARAQLHFAPPEPAVIVVCAPRYYRHPSYYQSAMQFVNTHLTTFYNLLASVTVADQRSSSGVQINSGLGELPISTNNMLLPQLFLANPHQSCTF